MSGARWFGVTLVIAALVGAIALAVISPSDPGSTSLPAGAGVGPSPEPTSIEPDARVPEAQPQIIGPKDGITTLERELPVLVTVPEYSIPRDAIALEIYRNGKVVGTRLRPPADDVEVGPIKLTEGRNAITAALTTSGGAGPPSDPIVIIVDKSGPDVDVTYPKENERVVDKSIDVTGTTEVGARVTVKNTTNDRERPETVGPSGAFDIPIPLESGENRIVVIVVDEAGNQATRIRRNVTRIDRQPVVKLRLSTNELAVSALPKPLVMTAIVTDSTGRPLEGTEVLFTLSVREQPSSTKSAVTNAKGQAKWRVEIPKAGARRGEGLISVEASAHGTTGKQTKTLTLR